MKKELDVVAALIKKDGKFLLCQRKEKDRYGLLWEFPGGAVEAGESLKVAIEREIEEELGIRVGATDLMEEFFDEDENLKIRIFLFKCIIKEGAPIPRECEAFGFFDLNQIESLDLAPADRKILTHLKKILPE